MRVGYANNTAEAYKYYGNPRQRTKQVNRTNAAKAPNASRANTANRYSYGNTARDPLGIIRNQPVPRHVLEPPRPAPRANTQRRPAAKRHVKPQPAHTFKKACVLLATLMFFSMLGMLVVRYAMIAGNSQEIFTLNNELKQEKLNAEQVKAEYAKTLDMTVIQGRAAELGMGFPSEEQVVYVTLPDDIETAGSEEDAAEEAAASGDKSDFWDILRSLVNDMKFSLGGIDTAENKTE